MTPENFNLAGLSVLDKREELPAQPHMSACRALARHEHALCTQKVLLQLDKTRILRFLIVSVFARLHLFYAAAESHKGIVHGRAIAELRFEPWCDAIPLLHSDKADK